MLQPVRLAQPIDGYDRLVHRARAIALAAAVSVLASTLTACTPTAVGPVSDVPLPQELAADDIDGPWAFTVNGKLLLALSGSSTCPTVPTAVEATSDDEVVVTLDRGPALACTADMQTTVYEIPVETVPGKVVLEYGDDRAVLEVATPRT